MTGHWVSQQASLSMTSFSKDEALTQADPSSAEEKKT